MESNKNARGNSKDPNHSSTSTTGAASKRNQPALTNFFQKQQASSAKQGSSNHDSANSNNNSNQSKNVDQLSTNTSHVQTRQRLSQQNNRESSQATTTNKVQGQTSNAAVGSNSLLQTPKKKQLDTPGKKRATATAPTNDDYINELQPLIDQKLNNNKQQTSLQQTQQSNIEDSAVKRSQRPRKVQDYKKLLEGDETTLKTIQDEQMEIKRKKREAKQDEEYDEDEQMDEDALIERASDDEEEDEEEEEEVFPEGKGGSPVRKSARKRTRRTLDDDEEVDAEDIEDAGESDNAADEEADVANDEDNESYTADNKRKKKLKAKKSAAVDKKKKKDATAVEKDEEAPEEETVFIDNLPNDEFEIRRMLKEVKRHIRSLEKQFFEEEDSEKEEELKVMTNTSKHDEALQAFKATSHLKQFWCIPLSVNVTTMDFDALAKSQMKQGGRLFDVITIDPPWQLSSANPTRGVAIAYDTLNDKEILNMPFEKLQTDGFLFIWVINAKYRFALEMMEKFGYKLVDEIAWVKQTVNGKIAKGHGYYLQHAKETCLVGVKGNVKGKARFNIESDVIFSQRRGQSQKPEEIYEIAEALVPNGYYLEIFGRRNNLHNGWVTIGNEL